MKIDKTKKIKQIDGKSDYLIPRQGLDKDEKPTVDMVPVSLEDILLGVLTNPAGVTEDMTGRDKVARVVLAERIFKASKTVEISADEVSMLKTLIGDLCRDPMLVTGARRILGIPDEEK